MSEKEPTRKKGQKLEKPNSREQRTRIVKFGTEFYSKHFCTQGVVTEVLPGFGVNACPVRKDQDGQLTLIIPGTVPHWQIGEIGRVWTFDEVIAGMERGMELSKNIIDFLRENATAEPIDISKIKRRPRRKDTI